jgi:hypothetical protein
MRAAYSNVPSHDESGGSLLLMIIRLLFRGVVRFVFTLALAFAALLGWATWQAFNDHLREARFQRDRQEYFSRPAHISGDQQPPGKGR